MKLLQQFQNYINEHHLFPKDAQLLLAVSGGIDSIVLTDLIYKAGYKFSIAHCNFQLRGAESEGDETFVKALGEKYKVQVFIQKFNTEQYACENKLSIQEAARALRYTWFEELVNGQLTLVNAQDAPSSIHHSPFTIRLLTAHHADDNIETLLMNFFRGTGLHGLTGIPEKNEKVSRPLLHFTKEELIYYAKENQLEFREDASNLSSKYTRNFFRNELIPAISNVYPQVKENLTHNIKRFKEIEKLYRLSTQVIIKKLCKQKGAEIHIPVKQLMHYKNRALIYEIIHPFDFSEKQIEEVEKLAESESGKYIDAPALKFRIIKHRHWFIIAPILTLEAATIIIEDGMEKVTFSSGSLELKQLSINNYQLFTSNTIASINASIIQFPLLLRKWKTGDYFYPLGMKKKKKVARFLIDQKLSKTQKENVWVLESNKKIVWVVGQRIDDRFKIMPSTKTLLQISFTSN